MMGYKTIFLMMLVHSSVMSQVDCDSVPANFSGVCKSCNSHGLVYHEANYVNGLLDGQEIYYKYGFKSLEYNYSNGVIKSYKTYNDSNVLNYAQYYENGILRLVIAYFDNGNKSQEIELNGTINNGWSKYYYSNGELKSKRYYNEGIATRDGEGYYSNGNLHYKSTYNDTTKTENYCEYYENGQKKFCWVKVNDVLVGDTFEVFYPSGRLKSSHYSLKNKVYVLIISYDEQGHLIGREINNHEAIIKKRRFKFRMNKPFKLERR